jgi:CheY-like chemotaxis protein
VSRIVVVLWNEKEAKQRARTLKQLGHKPTLLWDRERATLEQIRVSPPDLLLIDLNRLPSQGREIGGYFRRLKATRHLPILFVDGDPERVSSARHLIPDAQFSQWSEIKSAIPLAIRNVPAKPVVPGTMAGYSGTPLPKKLGIRENHSLILVHAPESFERKLDPMPAGAEITTHSAQANVAVLFTTSQAELARDFRPLAKDLPHKVALWIAWPKKASRIKTDIKENLVREVGLGAGWVDYKVCAIDETWSGLCFARRNTRA